MKISHKYTLEWAKLRIKKKERKATLSTLVFQSVSDVGSCSCLTSWDRLQPSWPFLGESRQMIYPRIISFWWEKLVTPFGTRQLHLQLSDCAASALPPAILFSFFFFSRRNMDFRLRFSIIISKRDAIDPRAVYTCKYSAVQTWKWSGWSVMMEFSLRLRWLITWRSSPRPLSLFEIMSLLR